jgi:hypothetical protein
VYLKRLNYIGSKKCQAKPRVDNVGVQRRRPEGHGKNRVKGGGVVLTAYSDINILFNII